MILYISEVKTSSCFIATFFRKVGGNRQFSRKQFTVADTLVSVVQVEYLVGSKRFSFTVEKKAHSCASLSLCCFRTSMSGSSLASIFFSGH